MRTTITLDGIQIMDIHRQGEVRLMSRTAMIITGEKKSNTQRTTYITNEIMMIEE